MPIRVSGGGGASGGSIKKIRIDPNSLTLSSNGTGTVKTRGKGARRIGLGTRRSGRSRSNSGISKADIIRKIRAGLLEKKRNSAAGSVAGSAAGGERKTRRLGAKRPLYSKRLRSMRSNRRAKWEGLGSTRGAIGFFLQKKRDDAKSQDQSHSQNQTTDINVDLPDDFDVKRQSTPNGVKGILKVRDAPAADEDPRLRLFHRESHSPKNEDTIYNAIATTDTGYEADKDGDRDQFPDPFVQSSQTTTTTTMIDSDHIFDTDRDDTDRAGVNTPDENREMREMREKAGAAKQEADDDEPRFKRRSRERRIRRKERVKTYKLGKKGRKVSVMVYNHNTRKRLRNDHDEFADGDINKMRRVLRHRCLLKTGSAAPPRLVREIYRNTQLFGDVMANCNANEANDYLEFKEY